jgi:hypothetical protein
MRARILPALLAAVLIAACATNSSFVNTWNLPGAQPIQSATSKMAVVFMSPNGERRRSVEDQMVHQLGEHGIQAVAAESIFVADSAGSPREMQRRFQGAGIDTVMTIRVLDQRAALSPGPPPYEQIPPNLEYLALSRYWGLGWGRIYAPGYLLTDTEVAVETLVYSLSRDDLLWGSRSRHVHKYQIPPLLAELGDSVPKDMIRVGLLAPTPPTAVAMK